MKEKIEIETTECLEINDKNAVCQNPQDEDKAVLGTHFPPYKLTSLNKSDKNKLRIQLRKSTEQ